MSNVNIYNKTNQIIIEQKKDNTINIINEQNNSRETNIQENKFIEPHSKIIWKGVVQNSYHFKQDIERVWLFVKNFDLLTLINC
jgi:hypothetical protein